MLIKGDKRQRDVLMALAEGCNGRDNRRDNRLGEPYIDFDSISLV